MRRPRRVAGDPLGSQLSAGQPSAGQSCRGPAGRGAVVAGVERTEFREHVGPSAYQRGGRGGHRAVPPDREARGRTGADLLLPLRGPGAMTLTLYTAHVAVVASFHPQPLPPGWTEEGMYYPQATLVVLIAMVFALLKTRGPSSGWVMQPTTWDATSRTGSAGRHDHEIGCRRVPVTWPAAHSAASSSGWHSAG